MSTNAAGSDLVQNRAFQKQLEVMDSDTEDILKQWKSQLKNSEFKDFPSDFLNQYKSDGQSLDNAQGNFSEQWNRVVVGRGDLKKFLSAYEDYSACLELMR